MATSAELEDLGRRIKSLEAQVRALQQVVQIAGTNVTIGAAGKLTLCASLAIDVNTMGALSLTTRNALALNAYRFTATTYDDIVFNGRNSRITQERGGNIVLDGKDLTLTARGKINAKGVSDVAIKGSKIGQN